MPERLPVFINPENVAARCYQTSGALSLEKMSRFSDRLVAPFGDVHVSVAFSKEGQHITMRGNIDGSAIVECQRCMQALEFKVDHAFELGLIKSEAEIENLLPGQEPLLIGHDDIRLADMIEDELELLLPMTVTHEPEACAAAARDYSVADNDVVVAENPGNEQPPKKNPFAALADLKK